QMLLPPAAPERGPVLIASPRPGSSKTPRSSRALTSSQILSRKGGRGGRGYHGQEDNCSLRHSRGRGKVRLRNPRPCANEPGCKAVGEAGLPSQTLQRHLTTSPASRAGRRTLFVVDESSLASSRQMSAFLERLKSGDRVLLV